MKRISDSHSCCFSTFVRFDAEKVKEKRRRRSKSDDESEGSEDEDEDDDERESRQRRKKARVSDFFLDEAGACSNAVARSIEKRIGTFVSVEQRSTRMTTMKRTSRRRRVTRTSCATNSDSTAKTSDPALATSRPSGARKICCTSAAL